MKYESSQKHSDNKKWKTNIKKSIDHSMTMLLLAWYIFTHKAYVHMYIYFVMSNTQELLVLFSLTTFTLFIRNMNRAHNSN